MYLFLELKCDRQQLYITSCFIEFLDRVSGQTKYSLYINGILFSNLFNSLLFYIVSCISSALGL